MATPADARSLPDQESRVRDPSGVTPDSILAAIVESSEDAIVSKTIDGIITSWNAAAERTFGYAAAEAVGRPLTIIIPPDRLEEEAEILRRIRAGEKIVRFETIRVRKDSRTIEVSVTVSPIRDQHGHVVGACKVVRDMSGRRLAQAALEDSEARHRAVIDTAVDGILTIDEHGIIESLNPAAERLFGASRAELVGRNISSLMPAPYTHEHDGYLDRYLRTGERRIIGVGREVTGRRKDGSTFPMDLAVSELTLGGRRMFTGIVRDISERKKAELRQRLLADELDHRVKNNLAAVLSLASQTLATSQSLEQFRVAFSGRLRAMAETHAALAKSRWESVRLDELAELVLGPFRQQFDTRVRLEGEPLTLPARAATPISLTLHELATNAAKYGALSSTSGRLDVSWRSSKGTTVINWLERGGPAVAMPSATGSGTLIINGLIRYELKGSLDLRYDAEGVSCTITVPTTDSTHRTPSHRSSP